MEQTKKCPYCGEEIQATAQKCRFCGEWLRENEPRAVQQEQPKVMRLEEAEEEVKKGYARYYFDEVCKKHLFDFKGKLGRKDYWMSLLFLLGMQITLGVIVAMASMFGSGFKMIAAIGAGIYYLILCITSMGLAVRRLHDTGRSGWWIWISLIPLVGPLILLYMLCQPGDTPSPRVKWDGSDWVNLIAVLFCFVIYLYLMGNNII